ncbi:MAG: YihA family ribosome biogenesis GTP-binding protein [Oscillospiraceae bacterium]|nr:YihA family ribosome biogenesis GTP-binding protein [Oscillospiraceae bacterium]
MNFNKAEFFTSYGSFKQIPKSTKTEIAFAGRSNVGKSSLINKIFNRKSLARVSAVPGKTATINFYSLEDVFFVDLPGYGYAKVAKSEKERWGELIEGYLNDDRSLALVFQLVDFRHPPTKDDIMMINYLIDMGLPFVVVLTKADKLSRKQRADRRQALMTELPCAEDITVIEFSALTGEGVEDIWEIIEELAESEDDIIEAGDQFTDE